MGDKELISNPNVSFPEKPFALWRVLWLIEDLLRGCFEDGRLNHDLATRVLMQFSPRELALVRRTLGQMLVGTQYVKTVIDQVVKVSPEAAEGSSSSQGPPGRDKSPDTIPESSAKWAAAQVLSLAEDFVSMGESDSEDVYFAVISAKVSTFDLSRLRAIGFVADPVIELTGILIEYLDTANEMLGRSRLLRAIRRLRYRRGLRPNFDRGR